VLSCAAFFTVASLNNFARSLIVPAAGAGLDAETSNGPLSLRVPDGYSAHLEAGTNNGPMSLGFPVTVVGRIGRSISTDLGKGGTTIRAITHNGPLSIERR